MACASGHLPRTARFRGTAEGALPSKRCGVRLCRRARNQPSFGRCFFRVRRSCFGCTAKGEAYAAKDFVERFAHAEPPLSRPFVDVPARRAACGFAGGAPTGVAILQGIVVARYPAIAGSARWRLLPPQALLCAAVSSRRPNRRGGSERILEENVPTPIKSAAL